VTPPNEAPSPREAHLVELVDADGRAVGSATVEVAHRAPGSMHRAFSVLLLDRAGRLLLQRRSTAKTRFPLRWANACCGHPAPGRPVAAEARRRMVEEIGVRDIALTEIGVYVYRAADPATGRVEHEYDHVLLGTVDADVELRPDPDEVAELRWFTRAEVEAGVTADPEAHAPWLAGVVAALPGAAALPASAAASGPAVLVTVRPAGAAGEPSGGG
jgi:isopentenyl-diphosphate delta-isomerase